MSNSIFDSIMPDALGRESSNNELFSSSSLNVKNYSAEELKDLLRHDVESILRKEFPGNPRKQTINSSSSELVFACPYCGDSAFHDSKKRGHMSLSGKFQGFYKCYNCGKFVSISTFLKNFGKEASDLSLVNSLTNLSNESTWDAGSFNSFIGISMNMLINTDALMPLAIKKSELIRLMSIREITDQPDDFAKTYLEMRNQLKNKERFLYDPVQQELYVLNMLDSEHVIGFQTRDLTNRRAAKYLTWNLSRIHKEILQDNVEIPPKIDAISIIFGIFNIDVSKEIIVTEGPMDAFLLPNAIAMSGANKQMPFSFKYLFMFDDDQTGRKRAMDELKNKNFVFLWSRFRRDYQLPQRKKWDVNDVVNFFAKNKMKISPQWQKYFSNDFLDIMDI